MTPQEAKDTFVNFRNKPFWTHQEKAIDFITNSKKRFKILEAPTGSGKTIIAMTSGVIVGSETYMVHSKVLQNQVTTDFPEAKSLFGRANYMCSLDRHLTCADCTHSNFKPCEFISECRYQEEKGYTLQAKKRILNYDYFLTECNYVGRFSGAQFAVVDEADGLENTLINFVTLQFTDSAMKRLGLDPPTRKTADSKQGLEPWYEFGKLAAYKVEEEIKRVQDRINEMGDCQVNSMYLSFLRERSSLSNLMTKINIFLGNVDETWIYDDKTEGKHIFRPLWMTEDLAEKFIWRHAQSWVLMSALFPPPVVLAKTLGIPQDEIDYHYVPSTFPIATRQIHIEDAADLTRDKMIVEVPRLVKRIGEILNERPDEKGLIHCVSYDLGRKIYTGVNNKRLLIHDSSNRQSTLDRFLNSVEPLVLISPSLERGISLQDDLCRFIICAKAPFLSLGDKVISARVHSGKIGRIWYEAMMLLTVLQMTGRGFRHKGDRCENFILDGQFRRVFNSRPLMLPEWWRAAISW